MKIGPDGFAEQESPGESVEAAAHNSMVLLRRRNVVPIQLPKMIEDVRQFHKAFGHPVLPKPQIPSAERQQLRSKLVRDEYIEEFDLAWMHCARLKNGGCPKDSDYDLEVTKGLADFGDAIADMIYYLIGTALEYGIPLDKIWDAVQQANMSKLWNSTEAADAPEGWHLVNVPDCPGYFIVYDETGKVRKPPSWKEPDIEAIIRQAMGETDAAKT